MYILNPSSRTDNMAEGLHRNRTLLDTIESRKNQNMDTLTSTKGSFAEPRTKGILRVNRLLCMSTSGSPDCREVKGDGGLVVTEGTPTTQRPKGQGRTDCEGVQQGGETPPGLHEGPEGAIQNRSRKKLYQKLLDPEFLEACYI